MERIVWFNIPVIELSISIATTIMPGAVILLAKTFRLLLSAISVKTVPFL